MGIEFDHLAIRAVRLSFDGKGGLAVDAMVDLSGDYAEESSLIDGLRMIKDRLRMGPRDQLAACLSGRQVSVSQIAFRRLPAEEMEPALRIELRKSVPFETAGSVLDYQVLDEADAKSGTRQVLVGMTAAGLLDRHLNLFERAGMNPAVVDLLPSAVGNALWNWAGPSPGEAPAAAVHVGPQISTIVIDGARTPFFNRYVYLTAEEFPGRDAGSPETARKLSTFAEEVARSLAFYEKSAAASGFQEILLLGEYLDTPGLAESIRRHTGLPARRMDLPRRLGLAHEFQPGRFDLAAALALRGGED